MVTLLPTLIPSKVVLIQSFMVPLAERSTLIDIEGKSMRPGDPACGKYTIYCLRQGDKESHRIVLYHKQQKGPQ